MGIPGFQEDRIAWLKTNFMWMMYRCGERGGVWWWWCGWVGAPGAGGGPRVGGTAHVLEARAEHRRDAWMR